MNTISYRALANRVGDMVLFNEADNIDENMQDSGLENGFMYTDKDGNYTNDSWDEENNCDNDKRGIYQMYAITDGGADYLKRNTSELVFYSEKMDLYFWGITHFGTSWDGVYTNIKA